MFCNNYCPELAVQPGTQPIRVLTQFYANVFENIRNELALDYPICSEVNCIFTVHNVKVESPFVVFNRITVPYTFLSFLWCSSYHFVNSIPHEGAGGLYSSIFALRKYSVSLLHNYSEWNKNELPNPEFYHKDIDEYVGRANFANIVAINYLFYHEFAHVALEHQADVSLNRLKEMEIEADLFAIKRVINLKNEDGTIFDDDTRVSVILGLLTAFATLTMATSSMNGFGHPDPDSRLLTCIESLEIGEEDHMWLIAGWFLLQWQVEYRIDLLDIPSMEVPKKESFMIIYRNFQKWKGKFD